MDILNNNPTHFNYGSTDDHDEEDLEGKNNEEGEEDRGGSFSSLKITSPSSSWQTMVVRVLIVSFFLIAMLLVIGNKSSDSKTSIFSIIIGPTTVTTITGEIDGYKAVVISDVAEANVPPTPTSTISSPTSVNKVIVTGISSAPSPADIFLTTNLPTPATSSKSTTSPLSPVTDIIGDVDVDEDEDENVISFKLNKVGYAPISLIDDVLYYEFLRTCKFFPNLRESYFYFYFYPLNYFPSPLYNLENNYTYFFISSSYF